MAGQSAAARVIKQRLKNRKLPTIEVPTVDSDELARSLQGIQEHFRMYEGDSGAPKERFVTIAELEEAGLLKSDVKTGFAYISQVVGKDVAQKAGSTSNPTLKDPVKKDTSRTGRIPTGGGGGSVTPSKQAATSTASKLGAASDVSISKAAQGSFLYQDGGKWIAFPLFNTANKWRQIQNFDGGITVAGTAFDPSTLNVANWDTAYGWGDHASGGYAASSHVHEGTAIDATAVTDGYVLTADGAGNSVWEAVPAGGLTDIVDDVTPQLGGQLDTQAFQINFTATSAYQAPTAEGFIYWNTATGLTFTGKGSSSDFLFANSVSGTVFYNPTGTQNVEFAGDGRFAGRIYAGGSSFETDPATAIFAQYTAAEAYIQIPNTTGSFSIWNGGTGRIANFDDDGTTTFYGEVICQDASYGLKIASIAPKLWFHETDATANEGRWDIVAAGDQLRFRTVTDAESATNWMTIDRSAGVADYITLHAPLHVADPGDGIATYFEKQNVVMSPSDAIGNDTLHAAICVRGGAYDAVAANVTGYCRIRFPTATTNDSVMMSMMIHGYNYGGTDGDQDGGHWCIAVGGYFYSSENWHNTSARVVTGSPPFDIVRFGEDETGDYKYILLGETGTGWNYPKVWLTDIVGGHSSQYNDWLTGTWLIDFSASLPSNYSDDSTASDTNIGGQIRWDGEGSTAADGKHYGGRVTITTGAASGGEDGDIHFEY